MKPISSNAVDASASRIDLVHVLNATYAQFALTETTRSQFLGIPEEPSQRLEEVITTWQTANKKWIERLEAGDESHGAEAKAEVAAAHALINFKCRTHVDVQRKVSLFRRTNQLNEIVSDDIASFLESLLITDGGAS